jgi:carbohydrate-selective porin OprB
MFRSHAAPHASTMVSAAILTLVAATSKGLAQEPAPPPTTPPAADANQMGPPKDFPGSPKTASVGGAEAKPPKDRAGLFAWGPLTLIEKPVDEAEDWLSEKARLDLGFRIAFFAQQATNGATQPTAAAQDYRMYGTFHAINFEEKDKGWAGNVYFRAEYRDKMGTDIAPAAMNTEIGALAPTAYGQDEHSLAMVQLYYEQFLFDGALRARLGKLDPDDYFNLGRFADDYRYFSNTVLSAFPASNHPSGGLGFNLQWYISPEWTLTGGATDVQGKKTHSGFDTIDEGKLISAVDLTYSPTITGLGRGNYRLGYEHRDAVEDKNKPSDESFYINIDQEIAKDIAPFVRYNYGTGKSTGVQDVFAVGLGIDNAFNRPGDAFGIGVGFDTPHEQTATQRSMEYVVEAFYRLQVTRAMQFTVGQQVIIHPINNLNDDVIGVFELRLVVDF